MTSEDLKQKMGKPQIARLKTLGKGIKVHRVLGSRVLVKVVEPETKMDEVEKAGLLYIPDKVKEANQPMPNAGVVLKVGPYVDPIGFEEGDEIHLQEGDMVLFSKFSGTDFSIDGETGFRILQESEILCTLIDTEGVVTPVAES